MRTVLFVKEFSGTHFSYYNIGHIYKLFHKKNCENISL